MTCTANTVRQTLLLVFLESWSPFNRMNTKPFYVRNFQSLQPPSPDEAYMLWDAHLLFIQKHEAHYHYVDVPPYRTVLEETGDLEGTQTNVITYC